MQAKNLLEVSASFPSANTICLYLCVWYTCLRKICQYDAFIFSVGWRCWFCLHKSTRSPTISVWIFGQLHLKLVVWLFFFSFFLFYVIHTDFSPQYRHWNFTFLVTERVHVWLFMHKLAFQMGSVFILLGMEYLTDWVKCFITIPDSWILFVIDGSLYFVCHSFPKYEEGHTI